MRRAAALLRRPEGELATDRTDHYQLLCGGGICRPEQFHPLPLSRPGANDDLNELFDRHLPRGATVYAFGEPFAPGPERGVHDVHQNQGNIRSYRRDDGVWQDGGLLLQRDGTWTAILLRFQSQSWRTDDSSGHAR